MKPNWQWEKRDLFGWGDVASSAISAAASLTGDEIAAQSQRDTNAANEQINTSNQYFQGFQNALARDFSAQQVQQQEAYQTQMSDTAMQRRMADNRAAGVNPLLAIGAGGASTPMGGAASASGGGAPGMIPMQNPGAAFSQMGQQASSALQAGQLKAQTDLMEAQADKTRYESGTQLPAQVDLIKAQTQQTDANSKQIAANINLIKEQIVTTSKQGYQAQTQGDVNNALAGIQNQNLDILRATKQMLISGTNAKEAGFVLGLPQLENMSDIQKSNYGKVLNWINATLQPINSAASAYSKFRGAPSINLGGPPPQNSNSAQSDINSAMFPHADSPMSPE